MTNTTEKKITGVLYGVGVGPGDADLLTIKAVKILQSCDIIAAHAPLLENGNDDSVPSMAMSIATPHIPENVQKYIMRIPMQVARFPAQDVYDKITDDLKTHLDAGKNIAVLCEGDPFFYGSFMYLFARLSPLYQCEIVPGVSSLMAGASMAKIALAARNDSLVILPAPMDEDKFIQQLEQANAAVIIKLGRHFKRIAKILCDKGYGDKAHYISHATMPQQKIMPLIKAYEGGVVAPYFSMIVLHHDGVAWGDIL